MKNIIWVLWLFLSSCLVPPCSDHISIGMTEKQVMDICGSPASKHEAISFSGKRESWTYYYDVPYPKTGVCIIMFYNGVVVQKSKSE